MSHDTVNEIIRAQDIDNISKYSAIQQEFINIVSGTDTLRSDVIPWAQAYGGHQFGVYAGQLGDGRALSIGQFTTTTTTTTTSSNTTSSHPSPPPSSSSSQIWELQLKGAGMTPYSRFADGLAVLRSSIREFLASEALAALDIPTTRALSIVAPTPFGVRTVQRETMEQAAIVCRVAESWVRFGSFELFYYRRDVEGLRLLANYVIDTHFSSNDSVDAGAVAIGVDGKRRYSRWFRRVCQLTASMIAKWQAYGFCHGGCEM